VFGLTLESRRLFVSKTTVFETGYCAPSRSSRPGIESARKALDPSLPVNALIRRRKPPIGKSGQFHPRLTGSMATLGGRVCGVMESCVHSGALGGVLCTAGAVDWLSYLCGDALAPG
jgi:hypothetical protein